MNSTEEWMLRPNGLAARLRGLRLQAGLTGAALAEKLGWMQPKISKIENGKQLPSAAEVEAWARSCGADDDTAQALLVQRSEARAISRRWRQQVREGLASVQRSYDDLMQEAQIIRNVELMTVPGLLQTPDYARYQLEQGVILHGFDPAGVGAGVEERKRRQNILFDTTKQFEFIVAEPALTMNYGPAGVMIGQLTKLLGYTYEQTNIWLGILPRIKQIRIVPQEHVLIVDDQVLIEGFALETTYREDVDLYTKAMDLMKADSVSGEDARQLILRAMAELQQDAPNKEI